MKQLTQTLTEEEALTIKLRVEGAGIPVVISGAGRSHRYNTGLVSVWVAIDAQYDDAVLALDNPGHIAQWPVNVEAFHQAVRQTRLLPRALTTLNVPALLTYAAILLFGIFLTRALLRA